MSEYFGAKVDDAIVRFQNEQDVRKKHEVFVNDIKPAFDKLINYHYARLPVARNSDVVSDCMSFLYEQINKFDAAKYTRGFPYFNLIVRNFFIQKLKKEKKNVCNNISVETFIDYQDNGDDHYIENIEEKVDKAEFRMIFLRNLYKWKDHFTKDNETKIINAMIDLFEGAGDIDVFNKKMIIIYIREMTGLDSKQVASNLAKMKKRFAVLKRKYNRGDI